MSIDSAGLARRLPRLHCRECVDLDHEAELESATVIYKHLKTAAQQHRFGLPDVAQVCSQFHTN